MGSYRFITRRKLNTYKLVKVPSSYAVLNQTEKINLAAKHAVFNIELDTTDRYKLLNIYRLGIDKFILLNIETNELLKITLQDLVNRYRIKDTDQLITQDWIQKNIKRVCKMAGQYYYNMDGVNSEQDYILNPVDVIYTLDKGNILHNVEIVTDRIGCIDAIVDGRYMSIKDFLAEYDQRYIPVDIRRQLSSRIVKNNFGSDAYNDILEVLDGVHKVEPTSESCYDYIEALYNHRIKYSMIAMYDSIEYPQVYKLSRVKNDNNTTDYINIEYLYYCINIMVKLDYKSKRYELIYCSDNPSSRYKYSTETLYVTNNFKTFINTFIYVFGLQNERTINKLRAQFITKKEQKIIDNYKSNGKSTLYNDIIDELDNTSKSNGKVKTNCLCTIVDFINTIHLYKLLSRTKCVQPIWVFRGDSKDRDKRRFISTSIALPVAINFANGNIKNLSAIKCTENTNLLMLNTGNGHILEAEVLLQANYKLGKISNRIGNINQRSLEKLPKLKDLEKYIPNSLARSIVEAIEYDDILSNYAYASYISENEKEIYIDGLYNDLVAGSIFINTNVCTIKMKYVDNITEIGIHRDDIDITINDILLYLHRHISTLISKAGTGAVPYNKFTIYLKDFIINMKNYLAYAGVCVENVNLHNQSIGLDSDTDLKFLINGTKTKIKVQLIKYNVEHVQTKATDIVVVTSTDNPFDAYNKIYTSIIKSERLHYNLFMNDIVGYINYWYYTKHGEEQHIKLSYNWKNKTFMLKVARGVLELHTGFGIITRPVLQNRKYKIDVTMPITDAALVLDGIINEYINGDDGE